MPRVARTPVAYQNAHNGPPDVYWDDQMTTPTIGPEVGDHFDFFHIQIPDDCQAPHFQGVTLGKTSDNMLSRDVMRVSSQRADRWKVVLSCHADTANTVQIHQWDHTDNERIQFLGGWFAHQGEWYTLNLLLAVIIAQSRQPSELTHCGRLINNNLHRNFYSWLPANVRPAVLPPAVPIPPPVILQLKVPGVPLPQVPTLPQPPWAPPQPAAVGGNLAALQAPAPPPGPQVAPQAPPAGHLPAPPQLQHPPQVQPVGNPWNPFQHVPGLPPALPPPFMLQNPPQPQGNNYPPGPANNPGAQQAPQPAYNQNQNQNAQQMAGPANAPAAAQGGNQGQANYGQANYGHGYGQGYYGQGNPQGQGRGRGN